MCNSKIVCDTDQGLSCSVDGKCKCTNPYAWDNVKSTCGSCISGYRRSEPKLIRDIILGETSDASVSKCCLVTKLNIFS